MALGFQLHNEVAVSQNCPSTKKSSAVRTNMYVKQITSQVRVTSMYVSFLICPIHLLHLGDEMIDFSSHEQMLRAMGSVERSRCPGLRPCYGGFNHAVDLYHTPAACWVSLETVLTKHGILHSSSTVSVVFTLCSFVSTRVQLFLIALSLLVCCKPCLLLIQSAVCLRLPCATRWSVNHHCQGK